MDKHDFRDALRFIFVAFLGLLGIATVFFFVAIGIISISQWQDSNDKYTSVCPDGYILTSDVVTDTDSGQGCVKITDTAPVERKLKHDE